MTECCGGSCGCQGAPLVDVSALSLRQMITDEDNLALVRSLERLIKNLDDPNGVISAFSSFVE